MVYRPMILWACILASHSVASTAGNVPNSDQYHIQTDEGPERYFRYQTQNGQYRKEKRLEDGTVIGSYAWIDDDGYLRQRDYIADQQGYRIVKNKNIYVGRNVNVGNAVKSTNKIQSNFGTPASNNYPRVSNLGYITVTQKPIYSSPSVSPSVEISLNSILSSTPRPILSESKPSSIYLPTSILDSNTIGQLPATSTPSNQISTPIGDYLPPFTPRPAVYPDTFGQSSFSSTKAPISPQISPTATAIPSNEYIPSLTFSTTSKPPNYYVPPSDYPKIPVISSTSTGTPIPQSSLLPPISSTSFLPSSTYIPSSTPRPSLSIPQRGYIPSLTPPPVSYLPASSPRPFSSSVSYPYISVTPTTPSSIYLPVSTPEYLSITPPVRRYVSRPNYYDANFLNYSGSPQYEHFEGNDVNPYIHQNGPTYPLDTRGHSFNPSYNNLDNNYDSANSNSDDIYVTNDGFRYYIPRAYHAEKNTGYNTKTGSFGYIDPFGIRRVVYYNAGPDGFKHRKNNRYVGFNATPYDPTPY